jgi:hypothetical protein
MSNQLPDPRLTQVYRLEATLAPPLDLGDIRYTLQTDNGDLLYVQSRGVRHGSAEVLARLGRGADVDPDRNRRPRSRLAEQRRLHQRRRPPGRRRNLRDLPRRMSPAPDPQQPQAPSAAGRRARHITHR